MARSSEQVLINCSFTIRSTKASKSSGLLPERSNHLGLQFQLHKGKFLICLYLGLFFCSLSLGLFFIWPVLSQPHSGPSGSHQPSSSLLLPDLLSLGMLLLGSLPAQYLPVPASSLLLSMLPCLPYPNKLIALSHIQQCLSPVNQYLLLPASKLELILVLAPSSLLLLNNAGKLLSTGNLGF